MSKKRIVLSLSVVIVALLFLLWEPIFSWAIQSYLRGYCHKCWGADLKLEKIYRKDGVWIIQNPVISTLEPISDGGKKLVAERIEIINSWDLIERRFNLNIAIFDPVIEVGAIQKNSPNIPSAARFDIALPRVPLITIDGVLKVHNGSLLTQSSDVVQKIPFQFESSLGAFFNGRLQVLLQEDDTKLSSIEINFARSEEARFFDIDCLGVSCTTLFQHAKILFPILADWQVNKGDLKGHISLVIPKNHLPYIIGEAHLDDLIVENPNLNLEGKIPGIHLNFAREDQIDPTSVPRIKGSCELTEAASFILSLETAVQGDEVMQDSDLKDSVNLSPSTAISRSNDWTVSDITGSISFSEQNKVQVLFDGFCIQGEQKFPIKLASNQTNSVDSDIEVRITGRGHDLAMLLPKRYQKKLDSQFSNDAVSIVAGIKKIPLGIQLDGFFEISDAITKQKDKLHLSCDLISPIASHEWVLLPQWQESEAEIRSIIIPVIILWDQEHANKIVIENGKFDAQDLLLDKYIHLLAIADESLEITGKVDIQGTFDEKQIAMEYDLHNFSIHNELFAIAFENMEGGLINGASYTFNMPTGTFSGDLPILNATYFDKKNGLKFTGIKAHIHTQNDHVHVSDLEGFCEDIFCAGAISVDYGRSFLEGMNINVAIHTLEGKLSQLKKVISNFKTSPFILECPLEGNLALRKEGINLNCKVADGKIDLQTVIQASITDGILIQKNTDVVLRDLSVNIDFDQKNHTFEFFDIQGALLVGPPKRVEEYALSGGHIRFTDYSNGQAEFDLWIGDKTRDVLRIVGQTRSQLRKNPNEIGYVEFLLDHSLSHFGDVHPNDFQLVLRDWTHVEKFKLELSFQLKTLLHDLQRFNRTGIGFLSRGFLKDLNDVKNAYGAFTVNLQYDDDTSLFSFQANSQGVSIGKYEFNNCLLKGHKKDRNWEIDQLQLDDLSFAANVSEEKNRWIINFLGMRCGQSVLVGLEGEFLTNDNLLNAKINLLNVGLGHLNEWSKLIAFVDKNHPSGKVQATGTAQVKLPIGNSKWHAEANLKVGVKGCEFQGLGIQDLNDISCRYDSNTGIELQKINTALLDQSKTPQACLQVETANYNFANHEIVFNDMRFKIHPKNLSWIVSSLQNLFPNAISPKAAFILKNLKDTTPLEGSINITRSEQHRNVHLLLNKGQYVLNGVRYELNDIVIKYDPLEFQLNTSFVYDNRSLQFLLRSRSPMLNVGEITLSDTMNTQISMHWTSDSENGFSIKRIDGSFEGVNAHLSVPKQNPLKDVQLTGELVVDVKRADKLLSKDLRHLVSLWNLGGVYTLKGTWGISPEKLLEWKDNLLFEGTLEGLDCECKGYKIASLTANVEATPSSAHVRNLHIEDPAGSINAENIKFSHWSVQIPALTADQLRPSLLRTQIINDLPESTFVIRHLDVKNFVGDLSNVNSFTGSGRAYCANPPKREKPNPLFNYPNDTLLKMGLDTAILCPISGAIDYEIKNGKIYLLKLKDMYSAARMSKFYIPKKNTSPSYIDFDGNIHMNVKMKQYNLLFKIAELFTIKIDGTIQNPKFSFEAVKK